MKILALNGSPRPNGNTSLLIDEALNAAAQAGAEQGQLHRALQRAVRPLQRYRCAACGFESQHYFWQCPGCQGWDTYPPRRLEDQ